MAGAVGHSAAGSIENACRNDRQGGAFFTGIRGARIRGSEMVTADVKPALARKPREESWTIWCGIIAECCIAVDENTAPVNELEINTRGTRLHQHRAKISIITNLTTSGGG